MLYRKKTELEKLFAHISWKETFCDVHLPESDAERFFIAAIPTTSSVELDRYNIKEFALAELRWPLCLPIFWDDNGKEWTARENTNHSTRIPIVPVHRRLIT